MLDDDEFRRWSQASREALHGADLHADGALHHWAAFLSEQAAQLSLKGFLHGVGAGPRAWGHDVVRLGAEAAEVIGETLPESVAEALRRLARHYIPARYPDAVPGLAPSAYYGANDATVARNDASAVLETVSNWWSLLLAVRQERSAPGGDEDST